MGLVRHVTTANAAPIAVNRSLADAFDAVRPVRDPDHRRRRFRFEPAPLSDSLSMRSRLHRGTPGPVGKDVLQGSSRRPGGSVDQWPPSAAMRSPRSYSTCIWAGSKTSSRAMITSRGMVTQRNVPSSRCA
jgi:hypothetical protein